MRYSIYLLRPIPHFEGVVEVYPSNLNCDTVVEMWERWGRDMTEGILVYRVSH